MVHSYTIPRNDARGSFRGEHPSAPSKELTLTPPDTVAVDFHDEGLLNAVQYVETTFQLHNDVLAPFYELKGRTKGGPKVFERDDDLKRAKASLQQLKAKLILASSKIPTHVASLDNTLRQLS
jgi:hypothetical protein